MFGVCIANAFNGTAIVFEALFEIDTKYTKFADKEYDSISAEVKKWFKKLVVCFNAALELHAMYELIGAVEGGEEP